jgi:hypothetical protein
MPRIVYTSQEQAKAKVPEAFLVEALDDDRDGMIDDDVWTAVAEEAADQVDARLGQRYAVPFPADAIPAPARHASLLFVLETLYLRRGFGTEENNPFLNSARAARKELEAIGSGQKPLTPESQKPRPSVAVFTEPARTTSSAGHLST